MGERKAGRIIWKASEPLSDPSKGIMNRKGLIIGMSTMTFGIWCSSLWEIDLADGRTTYYILPWGVPIIFAGLYVIYYALKS
jgi:hypothetical protein